MVTLRSLYRCGCWRSVLLSLAPAERLSWAAPPLGYLVGRWAYAVLSALHSLMLPGACARAGLSCVFNGFVLLAHSWTLTSGAVVKRMD